MALNCSLLWYLIRDPRLERFVGPDIIAVNLHNLTIEKHFAFLKLCDGEGIVLNMVTFAEELLCLSCSVIFKNEIQSSVSV